MTTELYRQTLNSARWRSLKWRCILQAGFRCQGCGRKYRGRRVQGAMRRFHLHHRHYRTVGHETFFDVVVLCPRCHAAEHGKPL